MNKRFFAVFLLLALAPACRRHRHHTVQPVHEAGLPAVVAPNDQAMRPDQDVAAFELEEGENPFNAVPAAQGQELLTSDNDQQDAPVAADHYSQSAKYGFKRLYFPYNVHKVQPDQKGAIEHNIAVAQALNNKGYTFVLEGHCDSYGSRTHNIHLSELRAQEAKKYLAQHGLKNVKTIGYGSEKLLVASGDHYSKEQETPNRRVEFYAYQTGDNARRNMAA